MNDLKSGQQKALNEIKVVHLTTIDAGGAYKAVYRMNQCMKLHGIDSKIMLRTHTHCDENVQCVFRTKFGAFLSKVKNGINLLFKRGVIFRDILGTDVSKQSDIKEADIIFVHWINSFLSNHSLQKLMKMGKPIVFVMHDMWLFTGGCHVDMLQEGACGKYVTGCGSCPLTNQQISKDISYKNFRDKSKLFHQSQNNISITGPSRWIVDIAKNSEILKGKNITYLANCYDGNIFYPHQDIDSVRARHHIITNKKIILLGAARTAEDRINKGIDLLIEALKLLPTEEYMLAVFGNVNQEFCDMLVHEYRLLGYINEESHMAEIYSMADVYVSPSRQESFGFTVCEAMACGTPVVAFPVGGILDQIEHKKNGYLAKDKDVKDLAEGVAYCVEHREKLGEQAAVSAKKFSFENMKQQYEQFIRKVYAL